MENEKIVLDGYLILHGKNCTFHFENGLLTVLYCRRGQLPPWGSSIEPFSCSALKAVSTTNRYVYFIKCNFTNWAESFSCKPAAIVYASSNTGHDDDISKIDSMEFRGDVVDSFFHPSQKLDYQKTVDGSMSAIHLKTREATSREYSIRLGREEVNIILGVGGAEISVGRQKRPAIHQLFSYLRIDFGKPKKLSRVDQFYAAVFRMFSFLHFRRDIKFDKIVLYKRNDDMELFSVGEMIVLGFDVLPKQTSKNPRMITFDQLGDDTPALLSFSFDDNILMAQLPESERDAYRVGLDDIRNITAGFEGAFNRLYPDMLSSENAIYRETKRELLKYLRAKRKALVQKGGTQSDVHVLDRLSNSIGYQDKSLKEKLLFILKEYDPIIGALYLKWRKRMKHIELTQEDMISAYVKARNGITHGEILSISRIGKDALLCYSMLQCILYIMQLKMVGANDSTIKAVMSALFR